MESSLFVHVICQHLYFDDLEGLLENLWVMIAYVISTVAIGFFLEDEDANNDMTFHSFWHSNKMEDA